MARRTGEHTGKGDDHEYDTGSNQDGGDTGTKQARKRGMRALVCKVDGGLVIQAVKADDKKEAETEEPKAPAKKGRKGKGK